MGKVMRQIDIIDDIANKTGFFKKSIEDMLDALEESLIDNIKQTDENEISEFHLMKGITIGGKFRPEHKANNPKTQEQVVVASKIIPYTKFTQTFKSKINDV